MLGEEVSNQFFELFFTRINKVVDGQQNIQNLLGWAEHKSKELTKLIPYEPYSLRTWLVLDSARLTSRSRGGLISRSYIRKIIKSIDEDLYRPLALTRFISECRDKVRSFGGHTSLSQPILKKSDFKVLPQMNIDVGKGAYQIDLQNYADDDFVDVKMSDTDRIGSIQRDIHTARKRALEIGLTNVAEDLSKVIEKFSKDSNVGTLKKELGIIQNNIDDASGIVHLKLTERDRNFILRDQDYDEFSVFYKGVGLLIDCLSLSVVTDRDAILNQLFLPASEQ